MVWIIVILALIYLYFGVTAVLFTNFSRKLVMSIQDFTMLRPKAMGILTGVFSVLIILASNYSRYSILVLIIGILGLIKALLIFFFVEKLKGIMDWWQRASDLYYRLWGLVALILAAVLISSIL